MAKSINLEFLNQKRAGKEEFEVTDYSIRIMKSQYEYLKEQYTPVM